MGHKTKAMIFKNKLKKLEEILGNYRQVIVAYSGGVDSAFLLKIARDVLGKSNVKAVTAVSPAVPEREVNEAVEFAKSIDAEHILIKTQELEDPNYAKNPENRCYFCKKELYSKLTELAREWNISAILNGTTLSDFGDWRPGLDAAKEFKIESPLMSANFSKEDVRKEAQKLNLKIWDKPATPCLASRFAYGNPITKEKLNKIELGESYLKDLGFKIFRLRHLGKDARLELGEIETKLCTNSFFRDNISQFIYSLGFESLTFDQYRSGRLNEDAGIVQHEQRLVSS